MGERPSTPTRPGLAAAWAPWENKTTWALDMSGGPWTTRPQPLNLTFCLFFHFRPLDHVIPPSFPSILLTPTLSWKPHPQVFLGLTFSRGIFL